MEFRIPSFLLAHSLPKINQCDSIDGVDSLIKRESRDWLSHAAWAQYLVDFRQ